MLKDVSSIDYPDTDVEYTQNCTIEILFSDQKPSVKGYYKIRWGVDMDFRLSSYYWYWDGTHWFDNSALEYKLEDTVYSWIALKYDPSTN